MPKIINHATRRDEIAEATIEVIGRQGIDSTRLIDVARAANATTGSITHYFEGKDAVLLAALDHLAQRILKGLRESDATDLIDLSFQILPIDEYGLRDWRVWLCFVGRALADPALAKIHKAYYQEFRDGLAARIDRLQTDKSLSRAIDPLVTADAIIAAVDGIGLRATLEVEEWPAELQRRQLEFMLRPLLTPR